MGRRSNRDTIFPEGSWTKQRRERSDIKTEIIPWARAFLTIYLIASIPLRIAFYPDFSPSLQYSSVVILDLLATVFFSYETIRLVKVATKAISPSSVLPSTNEPPDESISHTLRSPDELEEIQPLRACWLWWRVLFYFVATLPLEYLSFIFVDENVANYLMINRLLRMFYLPKYLNDLSTVLGRKGYLNNIGIRRTWLLFFTMSLAGHLAACGFYFVARQEALDGAMLTWPEVSGIYSLDSTIVNGGNQQVALTLESSTYEAYIKSLYWAYITMITTGFGDIVPLHISETIWCIGSMFVGVLITALTIANLQRTIGQADAARLGFQRKMEMIKKFMHYRCLPKDIQERVLSFYDHQWALLKGADEEQFLLELPRTLQQQVSNFMCRDIIASLPILRRANRSLLNALVECAEMNIFSPNDDIIKCGEKMQGALLVSQGEVELLKGHITERKMKRLDRFAQECLFVEKVSAHTIRSNGFSEVILIPRKEFQQIIHSQCDEEHIAQLKESAVALSKTTTKANKMFGSGEDLTPAKGFKKHCYPNSFFRKVWDCIILLGLIFYLFSIPLSFMHLVENTPIQENPTLPSLGYITDILFWIDAIFQWNYFFYLESGLVVVDRDHIRQNYYGQHNVAREIAGLIPFDLASSFLGGRYCHHARLVKICRIPNISRYMESIEVMCSELNWYMDLSLYRVLKLNILMLVVVHWVGCLWYMMASLSISLGEDQNWRYADEDGDLLTVSHSDFGGFAAYLRSVYWAIVGMSTVGYGDIIPTNLLETTFATIVILFGGLVLPAVVGGLAAYISNLNASLKLFQKKTSKVRSFLLRINVRDAVLDKVSRYLDYHWSCQGGVVEVEVMDELPNTLRSAVSSNICGDMVKLLPFLSRCDDATKQLIATILEPRVFMPSDCIVPEGARGFEMFFLKRGQAIVTSSSISGTIRVLSANDFFGESCLLGSTVSGATVRALTYCECFSLNREDFREAMFMSESPFSQTVSIDIANWVVQSKNGSQRAMQNFSAHPKCKQITMGSTSSEGQMTQLGQQCLVLPGSVFLLVWQSLLLGICGYNAVMIPFRLAFDDSHKSIVVDWALDVFFVVDMLLNYRFISFIQDGELVTDPDKIQKNYMARRFKMDLISTLPLDLIAYFAFSDVPIVGELLRTLKMIRLGRHFGNTVDALFGFLEDHKISLAPLRLVEFLSGVVLIAHWAACGFFFIARLNSSRNDCSHVVATDENATELAECLWEGTWIYKQIYDGKLPADGGVTWQHYIRSFNWALPTLVVVVIGDVVPTTSPETLYAFLLMAIGVTVNAAIVGNVANIVTNLENDSADFARRVDEIRNYMHKHHQTPDLHERVDDFTRFLWNTHSGSTNEDEFLLRLPYTLQTDVFAQTRTKLLLSCQFFDFLSDDIVKSLALCLKPKQYSAADVIIHAGDFGQSMFFLESGVVQAVPSDGSTVLATLVAGSFFGEASLFMKQPRASSVCAVTFCDVFELGKVDLFNELRRREINIRETLRIFTDVNDRNTRRNKAVQKNLSASKREDSKLRKLIDSSTSSSTQKQAVLGCFMPGSVFRFIMDLLCMALVIYFSIAVLYRVAFRAEEEGRIVPYDIVADLFFICDCYLRTHFAFLMDGSVCTSRQMILEQYIRNGMVIDALSCLSVLEMVIPGQQLRLLCLLRVLRIPAYFDKMREQLSLRGARISLSVHLLTKMIFFYAMTNHWVACVWFIIHRYTERKFEVTWGTSDCPWDNGPGSEECMAKYDPELGEHNICNLGSMMDCYFRSLHFSLTTLSTVGYGDIAPVSELETIYENIVVLLGACFLAGLIGAFGAYLSECDTLGINSFKGKIRSLKDYMNYRDIPEEIQASILFFHHCRWKDSQTLDERDTLRILPEPLQLDISFAVKQRVIRLVPILDSLPMIVQKRIAHALILQVYSLEENPVLFACGDIGWEIYFIASGVVSISLPTDLAELDTGGRSNAAANKAKYESIGLILSAGNHVGESCLSSESGVRQETVTAMSNKVEVYVLSKQDMDGICRLMGSEKGNKLRHALLARNNGTWHTFDEIKGSAAWDEDTNIENPSYKVLPWATPKPMGELTSGGLNHRRTMTRRRRASQPRLSIIASPDITSRINLARDELSDCESSIV